MNKVPPVTLTFWIAKICATTLGETAGDLLSMTLAVGYATSSILLAALLAVLLAAQLQAREFRPAHYWSVVLLTSTAGTTLSDYLNRTLALGYARGALLLGVLLAATLLAWRVADGRIAVDRVSTRRTEIFYWAAILCSNTLGTSVGDYLADDSGLGFVGGAALIGALILTLAIMHRMTRVSRVLLFWTAFVLTRPFGATFGDLLTKPVAQGGLDLGTAGSSFVLLALLVVAIAWSTRKAPTAAAFQLPDGAREHSGAG